MFENSFDKMCVGGGETIAHLSNNAAGNFNTDLMTEKNHKTLMLST